MIIESIFGIFTTLIFGALDLVTGVVTIPLDLINTLSVITGFGVWVVGADIITLVLGSALFWFTVKITWGVAVYVWRLLPLT